MAKKPPTIEQMLASGYGAASGVTELQDLLNQFTVDPTALLAQAQAQYNPTYNASVLAANQARDQKLNAYQNELSGLDQTYATQRNSTNSQYDQSVSSALNGLTKRGLGRSSIVGTTSASIENARNAALTDLNNKETDAISDIGSNMSLTTSQTADTLNQLQSDYNTQLESRVNELRNSNMTAQANLAAQIASAQAAAYQAYLSWYYKHGPGKKSSSSGSHTSGSSGSSGNNSAGASNTGPTGGSTATGGGSGGSNASGYYNTSDNPYKQGF